MNKVLSDKKALTLFTLPSLILFTALVFVPIIWSLVYTFFTGTPGVNFSFSGFANYLRIFTDARLLTTFVNNVIYKVYDSPVALTNGGSGIATTMPSMYMYSNAFNYSQFGYASVIALLILLECTVFTVVVNRLLRQSD